MINLKSVKNPMPEQKPEVRARNFKEVAEGYTPEMAVNEAMRCLKCRTKPCTKGCPVMIRIPDFVAKIAEGDFEAAYQIISEDSALPRICGRVCPQENQCEGRCVRGVKGEPVSIGRLERFVSDWHAEHAEELKAVYGYDEAAGMAEGNGKRVAVVGAGPAGLTCAGDLSAKGYAVTVYESLHKPGGVLAYGIPEFRLPKDIVAAEVKKLEDRGVKFILNAIIGRAESVDELIDEAKQHIPEDMLDILGRFDISREHGHDYFPGDHLSGNVVIEEAIDRYYQDSTKDNLFGVLAAILKRMQADGHFLIPVILPESMLDMFDVEHLKVGDTVTTREEMRIKPHYIQTNDGKLWLVAFTSREEYQKGEAVSVISNFIHPSLEGSVEMPVEGIILNPWGQSLLLTKDLINMILKASERMDTQ